MTELNFTGNLPTGLRGYLWPDMYLESLTFPILVLLGELFYRV
ncbi:unnamed protein product [Arabidopsis halleri]